MAKNISYDEFGFIMLRHVNSELSNAYWQDCYDSIRTHYPYHKIVIIDDNSDPRFLRRKTLANTYVVESEYVGRGELLPYIYYARTKFFEKAIILHDSVFVNQKLDLSGTDSFTPIWQFERLIFDNAEDVKLQLEVFSDPELIHAYENNEWVGVFGGMSVVTHECLQRLIKRFDLTLLVDFVKTRRDRIAFERTLSVLANVTNSVPANVTKKSVSEPRQSIYGSIHKYCKYGIGYAGRSATAHLPLTKVWTGR